MDDKTWADELIVLVTATSLKCSMNIIVDTFSQPLSITPLLGSEQTVNLGLLSEIHFMALEVADLGKPCGLWLYTLYVIEIYGNLC